MPSVNPGPASSQSAQTAAVIAPVAPTPANPFPQGTAALRLLGIARFVSGASTGDAAVMNIINSSTWLPVNMVTTNSLISGASGSVATLALGLFTAAAAGGTAIKSNAALASNTSAAAAIVTATTVTAVAQTAQQVFVNVGTALANSSIDIYLYGYDLTPVTYP